MKELRYKLIGGAVLVVVLCVLFYRVQFAGNASVAVEQSLTQSRMNIYDIAQELERQTAHQITVENEITDSKLNTVQMYGEALKAMDTDGAQNQITGPDQAVVRVASDGVRLPAGMPAGIQIDSEFFQEEKGWFVTIDDDESSYIVYYYKMSDDTFFLKWEDYEKSLEYNYMPRVSSISRLVAPRPFRI